MQFNGNICTFNLISSSMFNNNLMQVQYVQALKCYGTYMGGAIKGQRCKIYC
jgi:hypothetical protein